MSQITPRLLDDKQAAQYIGFTRSFLRNHRYTDVDRMAEGLEPIAPAHLKIGRNIRYTIPALDAWLDSVMDGTHVFNRQSPAPGNHDSTEAQQ